MEDLVGQVLALILFGALAIMTVYYTTERSRGHKLRQKSADLRGWEYHGGTKAMNLVLGETSDSTDHAILYRLQGKLSDARLWQINARFKHSTRGVSVGEELTFWQSNSSDKRNLYIHIIPNESLGVTVIGADKEVELKNISLEKGRYSLGQALRRFGMLPSEHILKSTQQLKIGSEHWQEKYKLFASDKGTARRLLDSKLQSALLDWAKEYKHSSHYPMLTFCPQGVQITLRWTVKKFDTLDQLVVLGQTAVLAFSEKG